MCIFASLLGAVVLVALGYIASWTSMHENTPKGLSAFGKVMAVILYVFAALVLIFGLKFGMGSCGKMGMGGCPMMMGDMEKMRGEGEMRGMMMHGMKGGMNMHEMTGGKEEIMEQMKKWKMSYPKELKESLDEMKKSEQEK